jgi:DNA gyrase subunit B
VERGHIYIAQPPLYKIKHGKTERYIKDAHELNQFLLKLALDGATLTPRENGQAIFGDALDELARAYLLAEAVINRLAEYVDPAVLHAALAHDIELSLDDEAAANHSAATLGRVVPPSITLRAHFDDVSERWQVLVERMHHGNLKRGHIDQEFLLSGDYRTIRRAATAISGLIGEGAKVARGEKSQVIASFAEGIQWLLAEIDRGLSKQRYKGLGEMNPEQLWETTMDPNVRRLLKVQIDDAIAADEIFTTLMGDEVEPRRAFIETNALNARNLDV